MVSALTGRLFTGGYSSAGSEGSLAKKRKGEQGDVASTSRSSGYAADVDQTGKSLPPFYVDFQAKPDQSGPSPAERKSSGSSKDGDRLGQSAKRQKTLEQNYLAHNVQMELARGGLEMPKIRQNCPRVLPPLCGIDMSGVTLVKSSDFSSLVDPTPQPSEMCTEAILSLAEACRHFYQLPADGKNMTEGERTDEQSITSSVTDTETETNANSDDDEAKTSKQSESSVMTMCDALSLCKQPRVVVLSSAPFTVVHVNAAYLQLTGLTSVRLLGQPFQDLILDSKWSSALNGTAAEPFDLRQMHKQVIKTRSGSQKCTSLRCLVTASPIGMASDRITHFALGLELQKGKAQGAQADEGGAPAMTVAG